MTKNQRNITPSRFYTSDSDIKSSAERLYILELIRTKLGLTRAELGRRAGIYPQKLAGWYSSDDIRLSDLQSIMDAVDITITPSFVQEKKKEEECISNKLSLISFQSTSITLKEMTMEEIKTKYPEEVTIRYTEGGRTKFIVDFLIGRRIPVTALARKSGFNPTALKEWFLKDDLKISKIYAIAKAYDLKVHWDVVYKG